jgi:hypothetical protein
MQDFTAEVEDNCSAFNTSITAAAILDYLMEPIFTVPLIGDMEEVFIL